jgi:hypothetical protein
VIAFGVQWSRSVGYTDPSCPCGHVNGPEVGRWLDRMISAALLLTFGMDVTHGLSLVLWFVGIGAKANANN